LKAEKELTRAVDATLLQSQKVELSDYSLCCDPILKLTMKIIKRKREAQMLFFLSSFFAFNVFRVRIILSILLKVLDGVGKAQKEIKVRLLI
jgi:hypothetical protein